LRMIARIESCLRGDSVALMACSVAAKFEDLTSSPVTLLSGALPVRLKGEINSTEGRMTAVQSTMLPLGTKAPDFELADPSGQIHSRDGIAEGSGALLVAFISNHCPYVKLIADRFAQVTDDLMARGCAVVAIGSNDVEAYPDDSPAEMAVEAQRRGYRFPYLHDPTQEVARAYRAACTPDFFVFDADLKLAYRGRFDSARPSNGEPVTGADLEAAVEAALEGRPPAEPQMPSMGCNIKWLTGQEPEWFA